MDFRSQLSAFANSGGGSGRDRSPPQRNNNNNNNNNNYGSGGGRGGGGGYNNDSGGRSRPRGWNTQQQGPPHQRRRHHSPDRDGLGDLRDIGYRIPRGLPPTGNPDDKSTTKHLALLVITIDELPYEHIWKAFCEDAPNDVYISVVAHAKFPDKVSPWLRQRLLVHPPKLGRGNSFLDPEFLTHKPNWGSVEITRAMLDLLEDGMRIGKCQQADTRFSARRYVVHRPSNSDPKDDPPVDQFVYISETCLPVATAAEVFEKIKDKKVSWVGNASYRKDPAVPKNKYEGDQFAGINRRVPGQYRWKADQWVLICRDHADQILEMDRHKPTHHRLWNSFRDINASDEMFFPTCLALLNLLRWTDPIAANHKAEEERPELVLKRPVTYTDWTEGMRNPACFTNGLVDFAIVARLARAKGCIMARKFAPYVAVPGQEGQEVTGQLMVDEWKQELETIRQKEVHDAPPEPKPQQEEEEGNALEEEEENQEEAKVQKEGSGSGSEQELEETNENEDAQEENQLE
jgi:hypothetical protein